PGNDRGRGALQSLRWPRQRDAPGIQRRHRPAPAVERTIRAAAGPARAGIHFRHRWKHLLRGRRRRGHLRDSRALQYSGAILGVAGRHPAVLVESSMLKVEQLRKSLGTPAREVLAGVSLHLAAGEYVAIMGESGAGKSTLLSLIAGQEQPDAGRILLDRSEGRRVGK